MAGQNDDRYLNKEETELLAIMRRMDRAEPEEQWPLRIYCALHSLAELTDYLGPGAKGKMTRDEVREFVQYKMRNRHEEAQELAERIRARALLAEALGPLVYS